MASVVVVGGGVAGLTCAWQLRRAGHEVEVLEREASPGGHMRSEHRDGFRLNGAAPLVSGATPNLLGVVRSVGLAPRLRDVEPAREAVLHDGRLQPVEAHPPWRLLSSRLLSLRGKAGLARMGVEVARRVRQIDPHHPERAAFFDSQRLSDGLRQVAGREATERVLTPLLSAALDCEPDDLSYAFGLLTLRLLASGSGPQAFEGGAASFRDALAAKLAVRTGCEVLCVETETAGARVRYRTQGRKRQVLADAAVLALPAPAVSSLCPKLTPDERGFLQRVGYAPGASVTLMLERPPAALDAFFGVCVPPSEGLDLQRLRADHHLPGAAPPGAGLLGATLSASASARFRDAPDVSLAQHVLEQLSLTPLGRLEPLGFSVARREWSLPLFVPGYLSLLGRFLGRMDRSPRLAFAGDYLVGPSVEGAVTSGLRAAREVAAAH
jgi:oxygen-dependent protoporphyrinogen oxidase